MTPTHFSADADVLVLQHLREDGPGYLGQWLNEQGASWQVRCTEAGDAYPSSVRGYRGLAVLGGAWSANDERPSLRQAEALIQEADARGIPVIGHCLGGQLMARALGGRVQRLPQPEVGWLPMRHNGSTTAREWLGDAPVATVFQWHQDGFVQLPPGAEPLASSPACVHQAFALGPHLAMQFHIEITAAKIADWLAHPGEAYPVHVLLHPDSVQDPARMHAATRQHLAGSQALAERIYRTWRSRWLG
ncbi:MAG: type 1 glutamine amidotransferase [Hydrogenophaga sp.]|uniref:type 1 glutamine amidotransferase n=1 Tax=Hydrogenophaga sp. TaxID=1904254 RepID=UPI002726B92C|nr:type 1 glutamine amidotransferase [Hydrogenophaga sp.]MDO9146463.1 type 1 glutamine amidotransferase [Hydrogenophaga sp.]MDO9606825.1 type 1 glutamine amidotransferase [Hydrogenophaga sp.]MDP2164396.1 type 1 glutamine amidotransferase [Hydrogenophaga sp.]MDP3476384.1 type 1 glutamine amidotransferase [Hydrogenophaga sp.]